MGHTFSPGRPAEFGTNGASEDDTKRSFAEPRPYVERERSDARHTRIDHEDRAHGEACTAQHSTAPLRRWLRDLTVARCSASNRTLRAAHRSLRCRDSDESYRRVLAAAREQWSDLGDDALHCLDPDLDPAWKARGLTVPYAPHCFETKDGVVFTAADGMDAVVALSSTLRAIGSIEYFTRPRPIGGTARQPQPQLAKYSVPGTSPDGNEILMILFRR